MQEKKNQQSTQNIEMMRSEPHENDPSVNIVTWSGVATSEDKVKGKQLKSDSWFRKASKKNVGFDLHRGKEMFMEARNIFMDLGASVSKNQMPLVPWKEKLEEVTATRDSDPTVLKLFL